MSLRERAFRVRIITDAAGATLVLRFCSSLELCKRLMDGLTPRRCQHEVRLAIRGQLNMDDIIQRVRAAVSWKMTSANEAHLRDLMSDCCLKYVEQQEFQA